MSNLNEIPFDISGLATEITERYVLFNGRISPFTNSYTKENLLTIDGTDYCSSEQFYQYRKALASKNYTAAAAIMDTSDPVAMKHAGDKLIVTSDWTDKARSVMEIGIRAKFSQNPDLTTILLDTGTRKFQECNRYDSDWGTGLSLSDAIAREDHSKMKGKNSMGPILESVRDYLGQCD